MFAHGLKESNQEVIELKDENISVAAMKIITDSIYSGKIHLNDKKAKMYPAFQIMGSSGPLLEKFGGPLLSCGGPSS